MNYKNQFNIAKNRMSGDLEWIDVAFAVKYLAKNDMNRAVNQNTVNAYAEELRNGWWAINGEAIIISNKDRLLDGQQRLLAIIQTGIAVGSMVTRGTLKKDFDTMNQGRIRSNGTVYDLEHPDSEKIGIAVSAVVKAIHSYKKGGNMSDNFGTKFTPRMMKHINGTLTRSVEDSVIYSMQYKTGGVFTRAVIASLHYLFTEIDPESGLKFMNALVTGDYGNDTAIRELRNHFIELKLDGVLINRNRPYVCGVVIKAWNAWRIDGSPLQGFEYAKGDGFPVAI